MVEYVEQKIGKPLSTAISTAGTTGSVLWLSAAFLFTAFALPENIQMNPNVSANVSAKQNRHPEDACKSLKKMVGTAGFEPTASCTPSKRATRLRHVPLKLGNSMFKMAIGVACLNGGSCNIAVEGCQ